MYKAYISTNNKIKLPLKLWEENEHIEHFLNFFNNVSGSKNFGYNVDAVDISPNAVEDAKKIELL